MLNGNHCKLLAAVLLIVWTPSGCGRIHPTNTVVPPPSVHHMLIEVNDLQRSIQFYRDLIGLRLQSSKDDFAMLEAGNLGVYLWQSHWGWEGPRLPEERPGLGMYPHFAVRDVAALVTRIRGAGYRVVQEPEHHFYGTEAFVADPDGYVLALIS